MWFINCQPASKPHESLAAGTTSWHADEGSSWTTAFPFICAVMDFVVNSCDDRFMVCFDDGGDNLDVKDPSASHDFLYPLSSLCFFLFYLFFLSFLGSFKAWKR